MKTELFDIIDLFSTNEQIILTTLLIFAMVLVGLIFKTWRSNIKMSKELNELIKKWDRK